MARTPTKTTTKEVVVEEMVDIEEGTVDADESVEFSNPAMVQVEKSVNMVTDFWATHNIGTRASLVIFMLGYIATLVGIYFKADIPPYVLDTTGWLLFSAFMTVTLGLNGVREIGNIIIAVKTGKLRKNDGE